MLTGNPCFSLSRTESVLSSERFVPTFAGKTCAQSERLLSILPARTQALSGHRANGLNRKNALAWGAEAKTDGTKPVADASPVVNSASVVAAARDVTHILRG